MEVMPKSSMLGQSCDMADNLCLWYTKTFLYTDVKYLNTVSLGLMTIRLNLPGTSLYSAALPIFYDAGINVLRTA